MLTEISRIFLESLFMDAIENMLMTKSIKAIVIFWNIPKIVRALSFFCHWEGHGHVLLCLQVPASNVVDTQVSITPTPRRLGKKKAFVHTFGPKLPLWKTNKISSFSTNTVTKWNRTSGNQVLLLPHQFLKKSVFTESTNFCMILWGFPSF